MTNPTHWVQPEELLTNEEILTEKMNLRKLIETLSDPLETLQWCAKRRFVVSEA